MNNPLNYLPKAIKIDNFDFSPCCRTHVASTGEIDIIKITKTEKYKGREAALTSRPRQDLMRLEIW